MKSLTFKTLKGIAATAALLAAPLCAQSGHQIHLQVPFGFMAGSSQFPAGEYTVVSDNSNGVVLIRNTNKGPAAFVMTRPAGENNDYDKVKLVFHRYGEQYFLSQVWPAGSPIRQLNESAREAELAAAARQSDVLSVVASVSAKR